MRTLYKNSDGTIPVKNGAIGCCCQSLPCYGQFGGLRNAFEITEEEYWNIYLAAYEGRITASGSMSYSLTETGDVECTTSESGTYTKTTSMSGSESLQHPSSGGSCNYNIGLGVTLYGTVEYSDTCGNSNSTAVSQVAGAGLEYRLGYYDGHYYIWFTGCTNPVCIDALSEGATDYGGVSVTCFGMSLLVNVTEPGYSGSVTVTINQ